MEITLEQYKDYPRLVRRSLIEQTENTITVLKECYTETADATPDDTINAFIEQAGVYEGLALLFSLLEFRKQDGRVKTTYELLKSKGYFEKQDYFSKELSQTMGQLAGTESWLHSCHLSQTGEAYFRCHQQALKEAAERRTRKV